jgi:hypothetical protein
VLVEPEALQEALLVPDIWKHPELLELLLEVGVDVNLMRLVSGQAVPSRPPGPKTAAELIQETWGAVERREIHAYAELLQATRSR